jgi:hypothetical protein
MSTKARKPLAQPSAGGFFVRDVAMVGAVIVAIGSLSEASSQEECLPLVAISSGVSRSSTFVVNHFTGATYDCALEEGQGCQTKRVE